MGWAASARALKRPVSVARLAFRGRAVRRCVHADPSAGADTRSEFFPSVSPKAALKWKNRGPKIVEEIVRYSPDVICLQEVDAFGDFLEPELAGHGYTGVWQKKSGKKQDGVATFWCDAQRSAAPCARAHTHTRAPTGLSVSGNDRAEQAALHVSSERTPRNPARRNTKRFALAERDHLDFGLKEGVGLYVCLNQLSGDAAGMPCTRAHDPGQNLEQRVPSQEAMRRLTVAHPRRQAHLRCEYAPLLEPGHGIHQAGAVGDVFKARCRVRARETPGGVRGPQLHARLRLLQPLHHAQRLPHIHARPNGR